MNTLEDTLTGPETLVEVEHFLDSQASIEAAFKGIEESFAGGGDDADLVSADAARAHIQTLNDEGMTYGTMAKLSGVSKSLIGRVLYGRPSENVAPQSMMTATASERLLSLSVASISYQDRKADSTGTIRRLQALASLGYSQTLISKHAGLPRHILKEAMQSERLHCVVIDAIRSTYDTLRTIDPPQGTPAEKNAVTKTKNDAQKKDWLLPSAWNGKDIDDPSCQPLTAPATAVPEAKTKSVVRDCTHQNVHHEHGTRAAYKADDCRCDPCKEANRIGSYENRKLRAYGRSKHNMVDAAPARKHLKKLTKNGWGIKRIAQEIDLGESSVWRIAYGEPGKTLPPKRILETTNAKIMSFNPPRRDHGDGTGSINERIDSTGTKRRIQALMSCGYSMTYIASEVGMNKNSLVKIMQGDRVRLTTAEVFKTVYDKLWDVEPPRSTPFEKKAYTSSKKMARENGWAMPMAWDDDEIDNPNCKAAA